MRSSLPDQFEPQLNLSRGRRGGTDDSGVAGADGIVSVVQEIGSREVGVIQNVEKLRSKLCLESFPEGKVLEQGEVHSGQSRSVETVTT